MSRERFPLHPGRLVAALDAIDREWRDPALAGWRLPACVLGTAAVCLLAIHYLKLHSALAGLLALAGGPEAAGAALRGPWGALWREAWWGGVHLVGYVLVPVLCLRLLPGVGVVADAGLRWARTTRWLPWYGLLAAPVLGFAVVASFTEAFTTTYPFYPLAGRSWVDLLAWEAIYLLQFACLEFFFRGFLLEPLAPRLGAGAIFVMALPYAMIHLSKPWPEAFGAVLFGILLGMLALRSRSIWGGVLVHVSLALSMDLLSLAQTGRWPVRAWPG